MKALAVLWFQAATGIALSALLALAQAPTPPVSANRVMGVVTQIQPGNLTLRTDAGADVQVRLSDDVTVLRVPPGAKDLKTATKITVSEISPSDRILVRGHYSDDQKSLDATSIILMTRSDLAAKHAAEAEEWQRHSIAGVVKAIDLEKKQITLAVPNTPPTPENPTRPVTLTLTGNSVLLRYAPDSVKFSEAKPSSLEAIKVGDQVRALGNKSEDGSSLAVEKLVSGTFRNVGSTVISVDATDNTVTVKDLATGKPLLVHITPDSKLRELPPFAAQMIARFNSGGARGAAVPTNNPPPDTGAQKEAAFGGSGRPAGSGGQGMGIRGGRGDLQQMLEHMPAFTLSDLKPGEPLIVVTTLGAKPSEVTAITLLTGVEPILAARPKGSSEMDLGSWSGLGGIGGGGGAEAAQ